MAIAEGNIEQVNDDRSQEQACSAIDISAAIAQAVKEALADMKLGNGGGGGGGANGNNTNGNGNKQRGPREKWARFDHYCFSKGVNTMCNGSNCNRYCKKDPNNHDPTATFDNRKGGSEKGVWKWMKWRGPDGRAYDRRGDEGSLSTPPPT